MKLQNLSVIFIVIVIPVVLVFAYYLSLQADTINLQTSYNTKLLESTKEAIDAFEINTVEWNSAHTEVADSKRRNVMASINTFTTSFANNLGVSGTSKEYILAHIPAIAVTLYDGYYIYSPAETRLTIKDSKGLAVFYTKELVEENVSKTPQIWPQIKLNGATYDSKNDDKILYEPKDGVTPDGWYVGENGAEEVPFTLNPDNAKTEYKHILKPFVAYSEKVTSGTYNMVINYTLDNYVTIYGNIDEDEDGTAEYVSKAGYLTDTTKKITELEHNKLSGIKFNDEEIKPELLSEQVISREYNDDDELIYEGVQKYNYVYEAEGNTKVYFDNSNKAFILEEADSEKKYLTEFFTKYKKCTIPKKHDGASEVNTKVEIYQNLFNGEWYTKNSAGEYEKLNETTLNTYIAGGLDTNIKKDYSAINYCVESYIFSNWVNGLDLKTQGETSSKILQIDDTNNPDPESSDGKSSKFTEHKNEVIREVVESNLNQAITSYSRNTEGEYRLPKLSESDWEQILRNVSIITFVQEIPIGLKQYNNYAIATSTVNKEYVDPEEIYLNSSTDNDYKEYYHMPYCTHLGTENLIGYRSIDYIQKSYEDKDEKIKYYFRHDNTDPIDVEQACYECIIQNSLYERDDTGEKAQAYYIALARERYVARMSKLPAEIKGTLTLMVHHLDESGNELVVTEPTITVQRTDGTRTSVAEQIKITEEDVGSIYTISSTESGNNQLRDDSSEITNDLDGSENIYGIITPENTQEYSTYKSNAGAQLTINNYANNKARFFVDRLNPDTEIYSEYVLISGKTYTNQGEYGDIDLDDGDAKIHVNLKYEKNYTITDVIGAATVEAYANINEYNDLTIVSKITGITGYVRLRFTNADKEFYSAKIYNIPQGASQAIIKCRISGDTSWYEQDWNVEVVPVNLDAVPLASTQGNGMKFYTIDDAEGLNGFSNAANGTQGPEAGAKTAEREFYVVENIDMTGVYMYPIAQSCQSGKKWFDGYFSGGYNVNGVDLVEVGEEGNHYIKNVTISIANEESADYAFGLFGWVGQPAEIENLIIDNISVQYTKPNRDIKVGGLAGFADFKNDDACSGKVINDVQVNNSTIKGGTYVGGIVGQTYKSIIGSSVTNCTVSTIGIKRTLLDGNQAIYVGGIVGQALNKDEDSTNTINDCSVLGTTQVNFGSVTSDNGVDEGFSGGIVGRTNGQIISPEVSNSVQVSGNRLNNSTYSYTGGIVGYKDSSQNVGSNDDGSIDTTWQTNCSVSGHDNVGGIIGYNAGGNISNLTRTGSVYGSGENVGGIVGCNTGGNITNCTNKATISGVSGNFAENVGGIVGCNNNKNITNCTNENTVTGDKNVGGIVGLAYGGLINSCENKNRIIGTENSIVGDSFEASNLLIFYNIQGEDATGTGGIAGKIYNATIACSSNSGFIECNFNGGGIAGLNFGGTIKYCFNDNTVSNVNHREFYMNRLGGICGAGIGVNIYSCYNKGTIEGYSSLGNTPLKSPTGGIIGLLIDNTSYIGTDSITLTNKYFEVDIKYLKIDSLQNYIQKCYNVGNVYGHYTGAQGDLWDLWNNIKDLFTGITNIDADNEGYIRSRLWYNGGIVGYVGVSINVDNDSAQYTTFIDNYYLTGTSTSGGGRNGRNEAGKYQNLSEYELKYKLYTWANEFKNTQDGLTENKYIYNTISPLEAERGYDGYGVLYWEIKDYVRLTTNIFLCKRTTSNNVNNDEYTNFKNTAYGQKIGLTNSENTGEIAFASVFSNQYSNEFKKNLNAVCRVEQSFNGKPVVNTVGCYRWIMMIPKDRYTVSGTTTFSSQAKFFDNESFITEGTEYTVDITGDTTLYIAPILAVTEGTLEIKDITVEWNKLYVRNKFLGGTESITASKVKNSKGESLNLNTDLTWEMVYKAGGNTSWWPWVNQLENVRGYIIAKPNGSSHTESFTLNCGDGNNYNSIKIYLNKYDEVLKRESIYVAEDVNYYDKNGNLAGTILKDSKTEDEERAYEAACTVYIELKNLVDILGSDELAQDFILHTAKVNAEGKIYQWTKKGDVGSWFTDPGGRMSGKIYYKITAQYGDSNNSWHDIATIEPVTGESVNLNQSLSGKDGHRWGDWTINNTDVSGDLAGIEYNSRFRLKIEIEHASPERYGEFYIFTDKEHLNFNITYGPNIDL